MQVFEEYELFLKHVTGITERRQNITTIYLSANAALITAMTLLYSFTSVAAFGKQAMLAGLMVTGLIACDLWRRLIRQHTVLLNWWYQKLREMEQAMPDTQKLLTREYEDLYHQTSAQKNIGLTRYELVLAWLFTAIYAILLLLVLISLFIP